MLAVVEKWKDTIGYQTGLLAVICGIAAVLLVSTELYTRPLINQQIANDQNVLLNQVLDGTKPANNVFKDGQSYQFDGQSYDIFKVKNSQGEVVDYVVRGTTIGYGGAIQFLIGVDLDGVIKGVRIISHSETPGLGDKIELSKSKWILSFNQHSLANTPIWGVKKDGGTFDQFSGATITPRAVVKGVHSAMLALQSDKEKGNE